MLTPLLYLAGLVVLVVVVGYGKTWARVLSLRLRRAPRVVPIDPAEVPLDVLHLLRQGERELAGLGFAPCGVLEEEDWLAGVDDPSYCAVYERADGRAFAGVTLATSPTRTQRLELSIVSFTAGGGALETVGYRAHKLLPTAPRHRVVDVKKLGWREHWACHERALAGETLEPATKIGIDAFAARTAALRSAALEHGLAEGRFAASDEETLRFRPRAALVIIHRSTSGEKARLAALKSLDAEVRKVQTARGSAPATAPADLTPEVVAHRKREAAEQSRRSGSLRKLAFFAASVAAFAVAFGISLSVETVVLLFGVLLFHELGHALAMRAFGYRDLQILFIPFLGAVAAGRKRDVRPHEEILVLLAGPVPGIAVGSALLLSGWAESEKWVANAAWMMLFLNYLNLLPLVPLDGGRILNIILFDRYPRLQIVFSSLSAIGLIAAGTALEDNVLRIVGLALLFGVPTQLSQARILGRVSGALAERRRRAERGQADELAGADPVAMVYGELQQPKFDGWNGETKYQIATSLLERVRRRPAGFRVAAAGMAAWFLGMTLPLGLLGYREASRFTAQLEDMEEERRESVAEWDAKVAAARSDAARAALLRDAGEALLDAGWAEDATRYLDRAEPLADGAAPELAASIHLLVARAAYASTEEASEDEAEAAWERAERNLDRALALREERFGRESLEVAEVLAAYPAFDDPANAAGALARNERLIAIYETAVAADPAHTSDLIGTLAVAATLHGLARDDAAAEQRLVQAAALARSAAPEVREAMLPGALSSLSDFYFARERYAEVAPVLDQREALIEGDDFLAATARESVLSDRAWLAYWQGEYGTARLRFAEIGGRSAPVELAALQSDLMKVPLWLDEATAAARAGDRARVASLLQRAAEVIEETTGQSLRDFAARMGPGDMGPWPAGEQQRRQGERARVLAPLIERS